MNLVNTKSVTTHELEDHSELNILELIEPTNALGLPASSRRTHYHLPLLAAGNTNRALCFT